MTIFAALLMALAAGAAEILPVSGSGHLYLLAKVFGVAVTGAEFRSFRAVLCFGVGFGGLLFYHTQITDMVRETLVLLGLLRPTTRQRGEPFGRRLGLLLIPATLPMAAALLLNGLRCRLEQGDYTLLAVSGLFCLSGAILFFAARSARGKRTILQVNLSDALLAGLAQVASIFPGLSRAGLTASVLFQRGLDGAAVAEVTGLMGVPVFLGAGFAELFALGGAEGSPAAAPFLILGFALAALTSFVTLRFFTEHLSRRLPTGFAYWCWGAAILSLILYLMSA